MSMRSFVSTLLLASTIACRPDGRRQTDSTTPTLRAGVTDSQTRLVPHVSTDSAQGTWIPPHFPGEGINVPATVSQDWMMTLQIGAQHIVFEKTPLDSLQLRLRTGPMGQAGDAAAFLQWLCFTGATGQGRWVLWLEAGEMDAGAVGTFHTVSVPPDAQVDHRCTQIQPADTLVLPRGLSVGLEDSTVYRLLGPPSGAVADTSIYSFERAPPAKDAVRTRVVLVTHAGRVVQIGAWRSSAW